MSDPVIPIDDFQLEPMELAPLMVHTVTIGNLSYSWEDYASGINGKTDLRVALKYATPVYDIANVIVNSPQEAIVEFTTFSMSKYKGTTSNSLTRATITCKPKEDE